MMGDRERCIQAQMDEYLSKPLQQNHLIQTILKVCALGGTLREENRESELARHVDQKGGPTSPASLSAIYLRPPIDRAATTAEPLAGGHGNPSLLSAADPTDPIQRARN